MAPSSPTVSDIPPVAARERVCFDKSTERPSLAVGNASPSVADVVFQLCSCLHVDALVVQMAAAASQPAKATVVRRRCEQQTYSQYAGVPCIWSDITVSTLCC